MWRKVWEILRNVCARGCIIQLMRQPENGRFRLEQYGTGRGNTKDSTSHGSSGDSGTVFIFGWNQRNDLYLWVTEAAQPTIGSPSRFVVGG
jgi:hypothetical protein